MAQEIRMNVNDGVPFYADEVSVIHNPVKIVLDFKNVTPRMDVGGQNMRLAMVHNSIAMEPYLAKELAKALDNNIKNFEKKFGKIVKPKAMEKAKKFAGADKKKEKIDYFG